MVLILLEAVVVVAEAHGRLLDARFELVLGF